MTCGVIVPLYAVYTFEAFLGGGAVLGFFLLLRESLYLVFGREAAILERLSRVR